MRKYFILIIVLIPLVIATETNTTTYNINMFLTGSSLQIENTTNFNITGGIGQTIIGNRTLSIFEQQHGIFYISDSIKPIINFINKTTNSTNISTSYIEVNVSVNETNLDTINITLYNSTGDLINSSTSGSTPYSYNFTGLADGIYYLNATANDTANNLGNTTTRTIQIDTILPTLNITNPINGTTYNVSYFLVQFSATDNVAIDTLWFSNGTTNTTYTTVTIASEANGAHTYTFYANDTAGNVNSTTVNITVSAPVVPTAGGGGSGGSGFVECPLEAIPSKTILNKKNNSRTILLYNKADFEVFVDIGKPLVPTLFGKKNILTIEQNNITIPANSLGEINISFKAFEYISSDTTVNIDLTSVFSCLTNYEVTISKDVDIFYDVKVLIDRLLYSREETVEFNITLENKGDTPDTDTNLLVYVMKPGNVKDIISEQKLFEVPVGNHTFESAYYIMPEDETGKYLIGAEYTTENQGKLTAMDSFYVHPFKNGFAMSFVSGLIESQIGASLLGMFLGTIIFIIIFIVIGKRRKHAKN